MKYCLFVLCLIVYKEIGLSNCQKSKWRSKDGFDEIMSKVSKATSQNCDLLHVDELHLPDGSVSHVPVTSKLGAEPIFRNRTSLLQVHNTALARGIFFSFILQKAQEIEEPGLLYHYMSVASDVAANKVINASAIYFSPNMSFTPSYANFFNNTMPLFAPRAYRADDFNDPVRLQKISTLNTIVIEDLGAVPNNSKSMNYSHEMYRINRWYNSWLPDKTRQQDSKITYNVDISYGNGTDHTFVFHGPPAVSDEVGPVSWFDPYFDCKRSNKWLMGGSVPITDRYARHTTFQHIEFPTYVAEAIVETDYSDIDINQCPPGDGNNDKNIFAGSDVCKPETTQCEPIHGFGLRRGGYQCRCKPGFRLPRVVRMPFLGETIERATDADYLRSFKCERILYRMVLVRNRATYTNNYIEVPTLIKALEANASDFWNYASSIDPRVMFQFIRNVTTQNCHAIAEKNPDMLELPDTVAYGKKDQLENEARMALRLAHFISSFLQTHKPNAKYSEKRLPDKPLSEDQMIGEVLSTVMANRRVQGCGVFFNAKQFTNKTYFAPYAYRKERDTRNFKVFDYARLIKKNSYLKTSWFKELKTRFSTTTDDLEEYIAKMHIRFNSSGEFSVKYDDFPLRYKAAELRHGTWTKPYFDCGGFHNKWVISYVAPFFGWDKIRHKLQFKGAVMTTMNLEEIDINQCPDGQNSDNAFQDTHKCDRKTSWCMPIMGRGFEAGGYKCECEQGYEYPYEDLTTYFDGEITESEFGRLFKGEPNRYDTLKCRIAGQSTIIPNILLLALSFIMIALNFH